MSSSLRRLKRTRVSTRRWRKASLGVTRQIAPPRRLVDVGGTQRIGLDAGLIEQRQTPRRAGSKNKFGAAKHADFWKERFAGIVARNLSEGLAFNNWGTSRENS